MKLTIHRGTNQIGSCITETESNGYNTYNFKKLTIYNTLLQLPHWKNLRYRYF